MLSRAHSAGDGLIGYPTSGFIVVTTQPIPTQFVNGEAARQANYKNVGCPVAPLGDLLWIFLFYKRFGISLFAPIGSVVKLLVARINVWGV